MPSTTGPDLRDLAREDGASAEETLANALRLYASIPASARDAAVRALRAAEPAEQPSLAREVVRAIIAFQLRDRRANLARTANRDGQPGPGSYDPAEDDALGAEAVARIKASREQRYR